MLLLPLKSPLHTPPNPLRPTLPQRLGRRPKINLQLLLNIQRQLRIIPIARHILPQDLAPLITTIPIQRDISRTMSTRTPIHTTPRTQHQPHLIQKRTLPFQRHQFRNFRIRRVEETVPGKYDSFEEGRRVGAAV